MKFDIVSNVDAVMTRVARSLDGFGPDHPGADGTVADDIVRRLAAAIMARAEGGHSAEGEWPPNTRFTVAIKGSDRPNRESGQMLSAEAVEGEREVQADTLRWRYGTGAASQSDRRKGRDATDRDKAERAHGLKDGQGAPDIERPFFNLSAADRDDAREIVGRAAQDHLKRSF